MADYDEHNRNVDRANGPDVRARLEARIWFAQQRQRTIGQDIVLHHEAEQRRVASNMYPTPVMTHPRAWLLGESQRSAWQTIEECRLALAGLDQQEREG